MNKKIIIVLGLLFCLLTTVNAYTYDDVLWNGYLTINLDKTNFLENEPITGSITIHNDEYYTIFDQDIIIHLSSGNYEYPSQFSMENVLIEDKLNVDFILPRSIKTIKFEISPQKSGKYNLEFYSWISKSMFAGADSIFLNPTQVNLSVNLNNTYQTNNVFINRQKTVFGEDNFVGPQGFPADGEMEFNGAIVITNNSLAQINSLRLELSICEWSCAINEIINKKEFSVGEVLINSDKTIDISMITPKTPSAYEINIKLLDGNTLVSMYKNRIIVKGATSKVRKIFVDGLADENYSINAFIAGSPDHYTDPSFSNFKTKLEVYLKDNLVEEKEESISTINPDDVNLLQFNLSSKDFDRACVIIEKQGTVYEKECIDIALKEARAAFLIENPKIINLDFEYIKDSKKLIITLTKETPMNGILRLVKGEKIIFKENVFSTSFTKTTTIDDGRYFIVVDDLDAKRQIVEEVVFGEEIDLLNEDINMLNLPCTGKVCENGFVCKTTPAQTKDGACCFSECISAVESTGNLDEIIPLLFWIAIIILIAGIFIFRESIIKVKGGKK